jgi:hypothetical protein
MYPGITKIYYRKPVRHVFTKPEQTEGTNSKLFSPSKLFFIVVHISAAYLNWVSVQAEIKWSPINR